MAMVDDEETQKRGIVGLMYYMGKTQSEFDAEIFRQAPTLLEWLPIRYGSLHMCYDDPMIRMFSPILKLQIGRMRRARLRMHDGTCAWSQIDAD